MKNLGSVSIFTVLYFGKLPILFMFMLAMRVPWLNQIKMARRIYKSMLSSLIFNELISILLDGYFEFMISGFL